MFLFTLIQEKYYKLKIYYKKKSRFVKNILDNFLWLFFCMDLYDRLCSSLFVSFLLRVTA